MSMRAVEVEFAVRQTGQFAQEAETHSTWDKPSRPVLDLESASGCAVLNGGVPA